jgi:cyclin B
LGFLQVDNIDENDMFPIRPNFLETQMDVTPKMRSVLLDWISEVHHQFNLENETFHMAVSMIDRYLQAVHSTPRKYLQLVGVTALFMASKYEELMPPEIGDFVYVTDDTYSKEQILQMEMKMFKALDFQLCKPLPIHFLRRYAKAAGSLGDRQYIAAKYFIELASIDYELTKCKPSEVCCHFSFSLIMQYLLTILIYL